MVGSVVEFLNSVDESTLSADDKKEIAEAKEYISEAMNAMAQVLTDGCKKNVFQAIHCSKEDVAKLKEVLAKYSSSLNIQVKIKTKKKGGCLGRIFKFIIFVIVIIIVIAIIGAIVSNK